MDHKSLKTAILSLALLQVSYVASANADGDVSSARDVVTMAAPMPWTLEEMQDARPYPLPAVDPGSVPLEMKPQQPPGPPGFKSGALPGGIPITATSTSAKASPDADLAAEVAQPQLSLSYPGPFVRWMWFGGAKKYPISAIGKLFFRRNGSNYVCSGSVIARGSVFTAAHCVHEGGTGNAAGWSTDMLFCPTYKNGPQPGFGCWPLTTCWVKSTWYNDTNFDRDFAICTASTNGTVHNAMIGNITGWLGYAWNYNNEHNQAFGYPADSPFDGNRLITCSAVHAYSVNMGSPGADSKYIGCDMTGGSSGGPWILGFNGCLAYENGCKNGGSPSSGGPWLNGVNSHSRCTQAGCPPGSILTLEMGSPPFTSESGGTKEFIEKYRVD